MTSHGHSSWTVPRHNFSLGDSFNSTIDVFRAYFTGLETFGRAGPCSVRGRPAAIVIECLIAFKSLNFKAFGNGWLNWGRVPRGHVEFSASLARAFCHLRLTKRNGCFSLSVAPIGRAEIALSRQVDSTGIDTNLMLNKFSKWIDSEYQDVIREEIVWRLNEAFIRDRP